MTAIATDLTPDVSTGHVTDHELIHQFLKDRPTVDFDHPEYGTVDPTGVASSRAAIIAANSEATSGSFGTLLALSCRTPGTYLIDADMTISALYRPPRGVRLKPAAGVKITLTGGIEAGYFPLFDLSAGGTISFGTITYKPLWCCPEWFGARGNANVNGGDTAAWKMLLTAIAQVSGHPSVVIECPPGKHYRITELLTLTAPQHGEIRWNGSIMSAHSAQ
jgi:hypothetical protein